MLFECCANFLTCDNKNNGIVFSFSEKRRYRALLCKKSTCPCDRPDKTARIVVKIVVKTKWGQPTNKKNPTISNVKSLDLWSEWRESNSRPLEPHSSALPKLRYTRISTAASLPKRGDMRYYTQIQQFCQQIFTIFFAFFVKSLIFAKVRALFIFALSLAEACLFPKAVSDIDR